MKNGVGDLQRGERYVCVCSVAQQSQTFPRYIHTDYIVTSVLKDTRIRDILISYDIACKWSINHLQRLSENHPDFDVKNYALSYLIPKFHLPGHGASCQTDYSFNLTKGVGRTHGETIEQEWAHINLAALSTREMGPGARHLTLDDSWNWWNWKKILGMGMTRPNLFRVSSLTMRQQAIYSSEVY